MKLMIGRGSGACSISAMALPAVGVAITPRVPSEVAGSNQLFYQEHEALAVIDFVAMVPVIITS